MIKCKAILKSFKPAKARKEVLPNGDEIVLVHEVPKTERNNPNVLTGDGDDVDG